MVDNMAGILKTQILIFSAIVAAVMLVTVVLLPAVTDDQQDDSKLPEFTVSGETDLDGNIFISFVYSSNIIMLDGKGNIVWSKHEDPPSDGVKAGFWDFKKHIIGGETYYSYHDQDSKYDKLGIDGYAPGERVILDSDFKEVKRISFEQSDTVEKGHPLDGHDFLLIDLDHYIMSGYIKTQVTNIPDHGPSNVVFSYLQEVDHGNVVWDWRSIDYPELYGLTVTDANPYANDFDNVHVEAPDYVHFNAMRLNDNGELVCSFRHLNTIMGLDRTSETNQILWKLSGNGDEFGLTAEQRTSSQHYVTVDGNTVTAFDNHNPAQATRIVTYTIDIANRQLLDFKEYRIDGKYSSACGSAQRLYGDTFALGWGCSQNDAVCFCIYDFAQDKELISVTLANPENFTYRCVYY